VRDLRVHGPATPLRSLRRVEGLGTGRPLGGVPSTAARPAKPPVINLGVKRRGFEPLLAVAAA
jgi:hypothetical protein